jgi:phosphatidylserine decarboxylase
MRIPLTKFGWPQVVIFPAIVLAALIILPLLSAAILPAWAIITIELVLALFFAWSLIFFRDPDRRSSSDKNILLAPADGRITDIETINEDNFIGGSALRIGIFMSIFDVHINRAPCNVKIERATYRKGKYKNAMSPKAGLVNESNDLGLVREDEPQDKLIVRQISGAIARRIVCKAEPGQQLIRGEKFGMIKFGSRTELYVPISESVKCLVKIGGKVKAGLTPIVKYE